MTTMVCFKAAGTAYCLPVRVTRAVRSTDGMIALPEPALDVAGILPGDPPLTVISPLRARGTHVLVIEAGETLVGLLVDEVTGLQLIDDADIGPAPGGQDRSLVCGTLATGGGLVLVADAVALAGRL